MRRAELLGEWLDLLWEVGAIVACPRVRSTSVQVTRSLLSDDSARVAPHSKLLFAELPLDNA
jgi:hypothetical protein